MTGIQFSRSHLLAFVTVDGIHGKGGETDGYVFGAAFVGSGVTDPLAGARDYGLSGGYVDRTVFVFYVQRASSGR